MPVVLQPVVYSRAARHTDLNHIVDDPLFEDSLVIFNDNFEDRNCAHRGANTAAVRPRTFRRMSTSSCVVVGVSTGWSAGDGGFKQLATHEKRVLWLAFERINTALYMNPRIKRVVYSCDPNDRASLGFATFRPHSDIVKLIKGHLQNISTRLDQGCAVSTLALDMAEEMIDAQRHSRQPRLDKRSYAAWADDSQIRHIKQKKKTRGIEDA